MTTQKALVSTVTNVIYGLTGFAMWQVHPLLLMPALFRGALMLGSGIHHFNLGRRKWTIEATRLLDYLGMYGVALSLLAFAAGYTGALGGFLAMLATLLCGYFFKSDRRVIGVLFAAVFTLLAFKAPMVEALEVAGWLSLAFGFNYLADQAHRDHHDILHGIPWHIPSAVADLKAALLICLCLT